MQNKWVINILLVIIMILVVVACIVAYMCFTNDVEVIEPQIEETLFSKQNYPKVACSSGLEQLSKAFKATFTDTNIDDVEVGLSKTNNVFVNFINGNSDLILVTYPTDDELKLAEDQGIKLDIVPIAKDGFVFVVNNKNVVENLTLNQIQNIYSGKIKNWKDVGGADSKILAFQKPEKTSSQIAMLNKVMRGTKMIEPITQTISQDIVDVVNVISDYDNSENAIGFSYNYYITTSYTSDTIRLLSVNGIKPTYDNIQTGLYDLQTAYYAVIRKDEPENSNTRKLLNAMISTKGQNVAKEAGYVQNY